MKKRTKTIIIAAFGVLFALSFIACAQPGGGGGSTPTGEATVITIAAIEGITPPAVGGTPVKTITENAQYSGTIRWSSRWSNDVETFAPSTQYTAEITLTVKAGYTLQGLPDDFFTVAGASSVYRGNSPNVIKASFPETLPTEYVTILEADTWAYGNIARNGEQWFKFTATADTQYIHFSGSSLYIVTVQVYDLMRRAVGDEAVLSSNSSYIFRTVTTDSEYYIRVKPNSTTAYGSYNLAFNSLFLPPGTAITTLTADEWAYSEIISTNQQQWFKFTATDDTQYIHFEPASTMSIYVRLYDHTGATIGSETSLYTTYRNTSRTVTPGDEYYIRVRYINSLGAYKIGFTASSVPPYTPVTFTINAIPAQTYTGIAHMPPVTVSIGSTVLAPNVDYIVEYADNINAGTATVTITGIGDHEGSSGSTTFTINKAAGMAVNAPTLNDVTPAGITIHPIHSPASGQTVEYAISKLASVPSTGWQEDITFNDLEEGTTYHIFARTAADGNHTAGLVSGYLTVTTLHFLPGDALEYYWVDQHGALVTTSGGAISLATGATLTITAQDSGYSVKQWYLNGMSTGQSGLSYAFSSMVFGNHTVDLLVEKGGNLYSTGITITVDKVLVSFYANGETVPAALSVLPGAVVTIPYNAYNANPYRYGYTFNGWNTNASGTGTDYRTGDSLTVHENTTLYAKWKRTITVDMYDSNNDGWSEGGSLIINVNGVDIDRVRVPIDISSPSRSSSRYVFSAMPGDEVKIYWYIALTSASHNQDSFIVYYTNMPPNPSFNNPTSWSGSNALVYRVRNTLYNTNDGALLGSFTVQVE